MTDADGNSVAIAVNVAVVDDIPVANASSGSFVSGSVQEDGMAGAATGDLSTGNKEAGGTNADDETSGASGTLTGLFTAGADEPVTIGLKPTLVAGDMPALLSHGEAVTYAVASNVLTSLAGGRVVFTLTVATDGSWSFDLKDQLDHVLGSGENSALQLVGGGSIASIDFSKVLIGTDFDGDTVTGAASGSFAIHRVPRAGRHSGGQRVERLVCERQRAGRRHGRSCDGRSVDG